MWTFLLLLLSCLLKIDNVPANSSSSKIVSTAQSSSLVSISTSSTELQPNVSSDNLTVTLDLNSSVFSNPPNHTFEPTPTSSLQTLPIVNGSSPPTTATPTIRCSDINWNNRFNECSDKKCVQKQMKILDMMPSCLKESPDNVSFSRMDVPEKALSLGMAFANVIKTKLENGTETNSTVVVMTRDMAMEVGVINMANYTGTNEESLSIPAKFTGKWADMGNYISMPLENLPLSGKYIYVVAIMPNVLGDKWLDKDEMDWEDDSVAQSVMSELYVVGDKLETRKKLPKKRINSNLLSVRIQHETGIELKEPLTKPALLSLAHLHTKDHFETTCVFLDGRLWSKDGCDVKETHGSQTTCRTKFLSTFALISKVTEKSDNSARQMVVTVATVMGSFSILGLLICAIVAIVINYHQWDSIRIALNIDVSLLLSQLIFFIGLPTDDNLFFSKPKTCEVVSPFVHLFELAALSWLLMEGLHYYSTLKPLFNEKNTVPIVFYFSVGWGLPVAFASACADFSYPHFGSPERSEFCWMFIRGNEAWFFGAPVLILVLLNLVVRAFILKEVITWQDDPDDIRLERAKDRLVTSLVMMLAIVLTWFFGILAVNNTEDKIFHYVFIVFYTLQGLLVFLFYCVRNKEMWEYRKQKKDEEEKEKNKTYEFVYHP